MPTAKGSQTIRRARSGQPGLTYRVTLWEDGKEYRNDTDVKGDLRYIDICYNKSFALVGDTEFKAYQCISTHTSDEATGKTLTNTDLWRELNEFHPVLTGVLLAQQIKASAIDVGDLAADNTFINALTVKSLKTDSGNVTIENDGSITAIDGTFGGKLEGVTGTFKKLTCVDNDGNVVGSITFGSEGAITFAGDMYSQGWNYTKDRSYRFYTSDVWCRGSFGAFKRNVVVVEGSTATFYTKGVTGSGVQVTLTSKTYSIWTYYIVPGYGTEGDAAGFPVDMIVFKVSSGTYNYELSLANTQKVTLINANDSNSNIYIFGNGSIVQLSGGVMRDAVQLSTFMNPKITTGVPGIGLFFGAAYDNTWA
jgi:hypothetical protein